MIDQLTVDFLACYSFSDTCKLDVDGRPTCTACRAGYTGRNCERCAVGYIGQPSVIGNYCRKVGCKLYMDIRLLNFISPKDLAKICSSQLFFSIFLVPDICDSRGSYSRQPDPVTGCRCKVRLPCTHTPGHQIFFYLLINH